jgi:AraC-like DNA-binding protein
MVGAMNQRHDRASGSVAEPSGMDVLADVLRAVRLTGAMLFLVNARAPWMSWAPETEAFRRVVLPGAQHLVSYHVVTQGGCWAGLRDAPLERYDAGDVLVVPQGHAYCLANDPASPPAYQAESAVAFLRGMAAGELPSVVGEGADDGEPTQFICGFLGCDRTPMNPVLDALPPVIHLRAAVQGRDRLRHLIDFALCELREPRSGSQGVLLRLAELMFVEVVRRHLETLVDARTGWLAGLHDPLVARALALLHGAPQRPWTLADLAIQAGSSRSVLAERFALFVGQPPMHYLAQWRMQRAVGLLAEPGVRKVAAVGRAVGYESEAAFSRAFKKCVGVAPAEWRQHALG